MRVSLELSFRMPAKAGLHARYFGNGASIHCLRPIVTYVVMTDSGRG